LGLVTYGSDFFELRQVEATFAAEFIALRDFSATLRTG